MWQCSSKFEKGKPQCETPHITEEEIKARFLKVYNRLIESKAAVIAACKATKERFVKCPKLQTEMDELLAEMNEVTVLTQQCIADRQNGHGNDFSARYNAYVERYETAKARYDEISELLDARAAKGRAIDRFLRDISGREELLTEFDAVLWITLIDIVTVRKDGTLVFRFRDGREIEG